MNKESQKIIVKCKKCNKDRIVTISMWRKLKKSNNGFLCRSCVRKIDKSPHDIICSVCGIKRSVSHVFYLVIKRGLNKNICCQCSAKNKFTKEVRKKMSDSKKELISKGWLPAYTKKYKGKHSTPAKECPFCHKLFNKRWGNKHAIYCSYKCSNRFKVANGTHHLWKGGITPINFLVRAMTEFKKWKQEIFQRDGYKCQECGIESKQGNFVLMHIDHIIPLSFLIKKYEIKNTEDARNCEDLWDIDNGRVLCKTCHEKTDTFLFRARNYQEILTT